MNASVIIHVRLLDEEVETAKRAPAELLNDGLYRILTPSDYDPEDETWQFIPGDVVRCERVEEGWAEPLLLAVQKIG